MIYPAEIMSVTELAEHLRTDRKTVLQWCHQPGVRWWYRNPGGRKIRIMTHDFEVWFRTKRR